MRTLFAGPFSLVHGSGSEFLQMRDVIVSTLKHTSPINRGTWQSEDVSNSDSHATHELPNVLLVTSMPGDVQTAQRYFSPDLPWAEDHFKERVSGEPLNPAPSYVDWPYHSSVERDRFVREGGQFDHTYPERFWPKIAAGGVEWESSYGSEPNREHRGIRFSYGDLEDVVAQLKKDPFTRQAYLPIFFPEDTGATEGQRVPCTLGYHFIRRGMAMDCNYFIRSCDVYRHFCNDVYMAVRLTQWITERLYTGASMVWPGNLNMFISNLHLFKGDSWRLDQRGTTC